MRQRRPLAVIAVAALSACATQSTAPDLAKSQLCLEQDLLVRSVEPPLPDDYFDVLDKLLPGGFGGLTLSYYYLVEPAKEPAVQQTIDTLLACPGVHAPNLVLLRRIPARQGQYSWTQLHGWYRLLQQRQPTPSGLFLSDIDESRNQLAFGFLTEESRIDFLARLPLEVPAAAVFAYVTSQYNP